MRDGPPWENFLSTKITLAKTLTALQNSIVLLNAIQSWIKWRNHKQRQKSSRPTTILQQSQNCLRINIQKRWPTQLIFPHPHRTQRRNELSRQTFETANFREAIGSKISRSQVPAHERPRNRKVLFRCCLSAIVCSARFCFMRSRFAFLGCSLSLRCRLL